MFQAAGFLVALGTALRLLRGKLVPVPFLKAQLSFLGLKLPTELVNSSVKRKNLF